MKHFKLFGLHFYVSRHVLHANPNERYDDVLTLIPDDGVTYSNLIRLLVSELKISYSAAKTAAYRLIKRGLVVKNVNGKYVKK